MTKIHVLLNLTVTRLRQLARFCTEKNGIIPAEISLISPKKGDFAAKIAEIEEFLSKNPAFAENFNNMEDGSGATTAHYFTEAKAVYSRMK